MADDIKDERNPFDLPEPAPDEKPEPYWLGTLPTLPQYNVGICGVMFHRSTNPVVQTDVDTGETVRSFSKGSVEMLTKGKYKGILDSIKGKCVRFVGKSGKGQIHNVHNPLFSRFPGDEPLAAHVYLVPLSEEFRFIKESPKGVYPPSVYELAGGKPTAPKVRMPGPDIAPEIEDLDKPESQRHVPPQLAKRK
jgi:hypothetical protein